MNKLTNEDILKEIKEYYKKEEKVPFRTKFKYGDLAAYRFNGWNNAVIAAGLTPNYDYNYPKEYYIKLLNDFFCQKSKVTPVRLSDVSHNCFATSKSYDNLLDFVIFGWPLCSPNLLGPT